MAVQPGRGDVDSDSGATADLAGLELEPQHFHVDAELVAAYVDAIGDDGFAAFAAGVRWRHGLDVAPVLLLDRYMSTYLVGNPAWAGRLPSFGVHAREHFRFRREVLVGRDYVLEATVGALEHHGHIDHLPVHVRCVDAADPAVPCIEAVFTRGQGFGGNRYGRAGAERRRPSLDEWLRDAGAGSASFPKAGAVLRGRSRRITQVHLDRFLGPGPNFHTDLDVANRLGFPTTVAAGVMATQVECDLYRDVFGLDLFRAGDLAVRYVAPIPEGVELQPVAVVVDEEGPLRLRTAVATEAGLIVTASEFGLTTA
jgi:hypothetical protein